LASGTESQAYITYKASGSIGNILTAIGTGKSLDETGNAYAQISYTQISILTPGTVPPIMTPEIDLSGNFTIIPNPNGGGNGVPISAWVQATDSSGSSWKTCHLGSYRDGSGDICSDTRLDDVSWKDCACTAGEILSESGNINYDIVVADPGEFPDSVFGYLFPNLSSFNDLLDVEGVIKVDNCIGIESLANTFTTSKIVAVTGDCSINGGIIGSREGPIILVIQGDLQITGFSDIYGIILGLEVVHLGGTTTVHGSLLAEDSTKLTTGGYTQAYDEFVLSNIAEDLETFGLAKQKYSWIDIQP